MKITAKFPDSSADFGILILDFRMMWLFNAYMYTDSVQAGTYIHQYTRSPILVTLRINSFLAACMLVLSPAPDPTKARVGQTGVM